MRFSSQAATHLHAAGGMAPECFALAAAGAVGSSLTRSLFPTGRTAQRLLTTCLPRTGR